MARVGVKTRQIPLEANVRHDLVFSLPRYICIRQDDLYTPDTSVMRKQGET